MTDISASTSQPKLTLRILLQGNVSKIYRINVFDDQGADTLKGKLKKDFHQLVEEQAQNEVEVEKRHLEVEFEKTKDELYDLLDKEKRSMEDQFNDRYWCVHL